jgi:hypothetical protein
MRKFRPDEGKVFGKASRDDDGFRAIFSLLV